jgi:hypothetical protein
MLDTTKLLFKIDCASFFHKTKYLWGMNVVSYVARCHKVPSRTGHKHPFDSATAAGTGERGGRQGAEHGRPI